MKQQPHTRPGGLPARWQRNRYRAGALVLGAAALLALLPSTVNRADRLDAFWLKARYSVRETVAGALHAAPPVDPDIAIIGIDARCEDAWQEPSMLWGRHFANVVNRLRVSGARVIVFDYVPYCDPTSYVLPEWKDTRWQDALNRVEDVVWAKKYRRDASGAPFLVFPHETLLFSTNGVGEHGADYAMGFAEFPHENSVVAAVRPVLDRDRLSVTLPARAVERYFHRDGELLPHAWRIPGQHPLPLRPDGTVLANLPDNMGYVNGDSPAAHPPFLRVSMFEFEARPTVPDPRLKGKIVFVGDALPFGVDRHDIPFLAAEGVRKADGVEIQAALTRALLRGKILHEPSAMESWILAVLLCAGGVAAFLRMRWVRAAFVTVGLAAAWIALCLALFCTSSVVLPMFVPLGALLSTGVGMIAFISLSEERERRNVLKQWGRYQDPRLVDYLLLYPEARGGEGEEKVVTVLFADLVSFTQTVEKLAPREALSVLNRYLALIETVVLKHGGLIDKYLGDGLMAQWGAPVTPGGVFRQDHERASVEACLEIEATARRLVAEMPDALHFGLRLTLHSGPVIFGWVGASRLEPTIIGDTVNVTSRLQETAKQMEASFLISEATYTEVRDIVEIGRRAEVDIRGRIDPLTVMEILGPKAPGAAPSPEPLAQPLQAAL